MIRVSPLRPVVVLLVAAVFLSLSTRATAAERPHSSRAIVGFTGPTTVAGAGIATHLGQFTEEGTIILTPTADPTVLHIDGTATYTAANGDQLSAVLEGELNVVTGFATATVTYTGGSGRFGNASGTASLAAQAQSDGTFAVAIEGTIDY